jgi:hypothetical protein
VGVILAAAALAFLLGAFTPTGAAPPATPTSAVSPTESATPEATPSPSPTPEATPQPTPTPAPTPTLVAAPLSGRLVTPDVARRHVIAVMVDDHPDARPQSGLASASVVWQAPAEGGIPRYMMLFQDTLPGNVGPIRSARSYFVAWAAEWDSLYAHVGGSPQALSTLKTYGNGKYVYDANQFYWGSYFWRIHTRIAPHNVYTDGTHLRSLATRRGAKDGPIVSPWRFAPDDPLDLRPTGGRIRLTYLYNTVVFDYDRASNSYLRTVSGEGKEHDADTGARIAPKNVIVMIVHFSPLNDGSHKGRLGADILGTGTAWIATDGQTIKGTWKKTSTTKPTQFFDAHGNVVLLTVGQTFIEVLPSATDVSIKDGILPPPPPNPVQRPGTVATF